MSRGTGWIDRTLGASRARSRPMTRRPAAIAALLCLCCPAVLSGQVTPAAPRRPFVAVRGVLGAGLTHFISDKTFKAVFGDARGVTWLGAGQLLFRGGMFAEVSVERFRRTGQRVFVFEGNVIPLGIADTVTITPITVAGDIASFAPAAASRPTRAPESDCTRCARSRTSQRTATTWTPVMPGTCSLPEQKCVCGGGWVSPANFASPRCRMASASMVSRANTAKRIWVARPPASS